MPTVGYFEPYATSHQALDRDDALQEEVRQATLVLAEAVQGKAQWKVHRGRSASPRTASQINPQIQRRSSQNGEKQPVTESTHRRVKTALDETRLLILGAQILLGFHLNGAFNQASPTSAAFLARSTPGHFSGWLPPSVS